MIEQDWNALTPKPVQDIVDKLISAEEEIEAIPDCAFQRFMSALVCAGIVALRLPGPRAELGAHLDAMVVKASENLGQWRSEAGF
jgi:hypothetical protein